MSVTGRHGGGLRLFGSVIILNSGCVSMFVWRGIHLLDFLLDTVCVLAWPCLSQVDAKKLQN